MTATVLGKLKGSISKLTALDLSAITIAWGFVALRILRSAVGFDDVTYSTPQQQITLEAWRHGRMGLWSTTTFGGTPLLGNPFAAGLYPLHWLAAPFPDLLGTDVEMAVHMLIFGMGMYALGRKLGLARPAPAVMAIAGMWSGAMLVRSTLLVHLPPLAWVPWAAILIHAVITSTYPRRITGALAIVVWLIITGGHPQSILMAATLLAAWATGLVIEHKQWRRIGHLAGAGALALVAAAPALIALRHSIAVAADSTRSEDALRPPLYVMPLRDFPRLLLGESRSGFYWMLGQGERVTYAGAAVVALSIVGIFTVVRTRRWSLIALLLVGGFTATLSLGLRSPTLRFARAFLPGFDQPRVSARWNWVLVMVLIILAGVGIDRLRRGRAPTEGFAIVGVAIGFALVTTLGVQGGGLEDSLLWSAIAGLVVLVALVAHQRSRLVAASLLAVLAVFELAVPINWYIEWRGPVVTSTDELLGPGEQWLAEQPGLTLAITGDGFDPYYLVQGMRPNANSIADVRSIDGYDGGSAISRRWHAGLLQIIPTITDFTFAAQVQYPIEQAAMARLGVHYVMWDPARGPADEALPGWEQQSVDGQFEIYENTLWKGDAIVWYSTQQVATPEDAGNQLRLDHGDLDEIGFVEDESAVLVCASECAAEGFVTTSDYSGQREVDIVASRAAVVAINEQFDDGWVVTVDGKEQQLIAVDGIWSGVAVEAGSHHIELRYEPTWLWPSIWIMVIGGLAIAGVVCWPDRRRTQVTDEPVATDASEP
ncbi:MAG: YfhO family protein [Actinomycetia bacterium]|nr:YfhO family protein [Actinomycetes bacterium]